MSLSLLLLLLLPGVFVICGVFSEGRWLENPSCSAYRAMTRRTFLPVTLERCRARRRTLWAFIAVSRRDHRTLAVMRALAHKWGKSHVTFSMAATGNERIFDHARDLTANGHISSPSISEFSPKKLPFRNVATTSRASQSTISTSPAKTKLTSREISPSWKMKSPGPCCECWRNSSR